MCQSVDNIYQDGMHQSRADDLVFLYEFIFNEKAGWRHNEDISLQEWTDGLLTASCPTHQDTPPEGYKDRCTPG